MIDANTEQAGISAALIDAARLTHRQREVLDLIARGRSNKEIARALCIGNSAVSKHVSNILQKIPARSRAEAAARWAEWKVARTWTSDLRPTPPPQP